ncbi:MAG TPA: hypothetical protein VFQ53_06415 [Kofleriaceae bacterium]|nr:hypothetical protein [Kofleriaceae bacterium]
MIAATLGGCGYGIDYADCEVSCVGSGSDACPSGFTCMAGMCRIEGAGASCQAPGEVTLRQTTDDKVERALELGCTNPDNSTATGSWYRVFNLAQSGVDGSFKVDHVTLGICFAVGTPTITLKLGTYAGGAADPTLDLTKVTMLGQTTVMVPATQITELVEGKIAATVPANSNLIVEVAVPDLNGTGQEVNMGFTAGGEQKPGYVRSPLCGPATPTTTTGAGLPNAHLVMTVTGTP